MKQFFYTGIILLCLCLLSACPVNNNTSDEEPDYHIPIIWKSDIQDRSGFLLITSDGTGIYVSNSINYEDIENWEEFKINTLRLNKINHENGEIVWSTDYFKSVFICQPVIIGNYIYLITTDNIVICIDKTTGITSARAKLAYGDLNMQINMNYIAYKNYVYFGYSEIDAAGNTHGENYLARFDANMIIMNGNAQVQILEPELLWQSRYNNVIHESRPVVYDDVVYCSTMTTNGQTPVEIAGININTKEEIFYKTIGENGEAPYGDGGGEYSLYAVNDILYYFGRLFTAYDLKANKQLYFINIGVYTLPKDNYSVLYRPPTFYNNNAYYTNTLGYLFCVDGMKGKPIWSVSPKEEYSLLTNPIIYDSKVFIPHESGIRVYNPDNGQLIGVEKTIKGNGYAFNLLNGSTMITSMFSDEYPDGQLIALDLRK